VLKRIVPVGELKGKFEVLAQHRGECVIQATVGRWEGQHFYVKERGGRQKALAVEEDRALQLVKKILGKLRRTKETISIGEIPHEVLVDEPRLKLIRGTSGKYAGSYYYVLGNKALFFTPSLAKRFLAALKKQ
jgi:hypothetical protein